MTITEPRVGDANCWTERRGRGRVVEPDEELLHTDMVELACQVNGTVRGRINVPTGASEDAIRDIALWLAEVQQAVGEGSVKRVIVVPGRLVNVVVG